MRRQLGILSLVALLVTACGDVDEPPLVESNNEADADASSSPELGVPAPREDGGVDAGIDEPDEGVAPCVALDCTQVGGACGAIDDGCGATLQCECAAGFSCSSGTCEAVPTVADCSPIEAHASSELCVSTTTSCAGVFTDGLGCDAFCARAGMVCTARFGGEPGCNKEAEVLSCGANNGHLSDWCECGLSGMPVPDPPPPTGCPSDAANPRRSFDMPYTQAVFSPRTSWVLQCRAYTYTAQFAEHEACDNLYQQGSGRGTATFDFANVPPGRYDVFVEGRHTENRNPAGMRVVVTSRGADYVETIQQRDAGNLELDLHGNYCLEGAVRVLIDSSVNSGSDSVSKVVLTPAN